MQNFTDVAGNTALKDSRVPLIDNDKTIMSGHSGTAFPTTDLQIGMRCVRTDLQKEYVLASAGVWRFVSDLSSDVDTQFAAAAHGHAISDVSNLQSTLNSKADLVGGLVPSNQLPSFVDDVLEYANLAAFPATGSTGKIYVAINGGASLANPTKQYRWSGSAYVLIPSAPGSTDEVAEGTTNLYFTTGRASSAAPVQSVAGKTGTITLAKGDVGLGNVDNTADANKPVSSATQTALNAKQDTLTSGTNIKTVNGASLLGSGDITVSGGQTYVSKTANYTASDKEGVLTNTTSGSFTVTLPATPTTGMQVVVADAAGTWGTNNLTIARNGATISGLASNLTCDLTGASVTLVYGNSTWNVYAQFGLAHS